MKRYFKVIILIGSHLLVLGAGFYGAFWYATENLKKANALINSSSILSRYLMLAQAERGLGNNENYRDALLIFLKALDESRSPHDPLFTEHTYWVDKTLTYARLSLIEKKIGDLNESKEYLNKAMEMCEKTGWTDCSSEKLIWTIERLDKNWVFSLPEEKDKK